MMLANNCYTYRNVTSGASPANQYISEQIEIWREHLESCFCLGLQDILEELYTIAEECNKTGWDGYDAIPVNEITLQNARQFLTALPAKINKPTISAEPDGCLTFEWYRSPYRVFSISITQDSYLHYASLVGNNKKYGTVKFLDCIPKDIIILIAEITG